MSDEDIVDPLDTLREGCREKEACAKLGEKLSTCNDRVNSRIKTAETCVEELIDFIHCVDHCAAKKVFNHLK